MIFYHTIILLSRLSIIFCLFSGDIYLFLGIFLGIFLAFWLATVSELFCFEFFEALWFFDIPLIYYLNISLSIISCLSFGDIFIFSIYFFIILICNCFGIILLRIFWNFCNSIINFITNQITSCFTKYFLNCSFRISFKCIFFSIRIFFYIFFKRWSRTFLLNLPLQFLLIFLPILIPMKKQKINIHSLLQIWIDWNEYLITFYTLHFN